MQEKLEENLRLILNEKAMKIIPENIKKGIKIFDVDGAVEVGESGAKLFASIEEMNNDTTSQEGNIAVVYSNTMGNVDLKKEVNKLIFPNEVVVLPEAVVGSHSSPLMSSGYSYRPEFFINETDFQMYDMYADKNVHYESTDGITYTRRTFTGATEENTITYDESLMLMDGEWDEIFNYFVQTEVGEFNGVYQYQSYNNPNLLKMYSGIKPEQQGTEYVLTYEDMIQDDIAELGDFYWNTVKNAVNLRAYIDALMVKKSEGIYWIYYYRYDTTSSYSNPLYVCYENGQRFVIYNGETSVTNPMYKLVIDVNNKTYQETQLTVLGTKCNGQRNYYDTIDDTDYCQALCVGSAGLTWDRNLVCFQYDTATSSIVSASKQAEKGQEMVYLPAKTQFTLTNSDYLYQGYSVWGKDGEISGTLGDNVSNTLCDVNAEVMSMIQKKYDKMEDIVITDSNRSMCRDLYLLPRRTDGTYCVDFSQLTNGLQLFAWNQNLVHIAGLNFESLTGSIQGMFEDCYNLEKVEPFNMTGVTGVTHLFWGSSSLKSIPLIDTKNIPNFYVFAAGCTSLVDVPVLDTSGVNTSGEYYGMSRMFDDCPNLSDESLNNIMEMCINAVNMTDSSNKTLKSVGLSEEQVVKCQALSNYSTLISKGWTTGY